MAHGEIRELPLTLNLNIMIIKYNSSQLPEILRDMASYVENLEEDCERDYYFTVVAQSGLFHDAIGKMIEFDDDFTSVVVTTDY